MGLTRIHKKFLEQNYYYLLGLYKYTLRKRGASYNEAFKYFKKSVTHSNQMVNS